MTLDEIETQVRRLAEPDLLRFSNWFDDFRVSQVPEEIAESQKSEVRRRLAEYSRNSNVALPWNDGFLEKLRSGLTDGPAEASRVQ